MLKTITNQLRKRGFKPLMKGEGLATFIYVTGEGRAVEICETDGKIGVEFWNNTDPDSYEPSADEKIYESVDEAFTAVVDWLEDVRHK